MKPFWIVLLALALGASGGFAAAVVQRGWPDQADPLDTSHFFERQVRGPNPRLDLPESGFRFGEMSSDEKGSHRFVIQNGGDAPLELKLLNTSCACTLSQLENNVIAPGKETSVVLTWDTRGRGGKFLQTATFRSNDPRRRYFDLTISGTVKRTLSLLPAELSLGTFDSRESKHESVLLLAYHADGLDVTGHEFLNSQIAEFFELVKTPLHEDSIKNHQARDGVELKLTLKPGLPLGRFQQTIRLHTNLEPDKPLEARITGQVSGPILIFGKGWNSTRNVLEIGQVTAAGDQRTLNVTVRGEQREGIEVKLVSVKPEIMQVEIGEPVHTSRVARIPLKINVTPGAAAVSFLGSREGGYGQIVLETNHPRQPELRIDVSVAADAQKE